MFRFNRLHLKLIIPFILILSLLTVINITIVIQILSSISSKTIDATSVPFNIYKTKLLLISIFIIASLITTLLVVFIYSYLIRKYISMPVKKLISGFRNIGANNLDFHLNVNSNDEFGLLADKFNNMIELIKKSNDELKNMNVKLIEQEKLKLLSTISAGLGHELNNPLTNMSLQLEIMNKVIKKLKDEESKDKVISLTNSFENEIDRAVNILKKFSNFTNLKLNEVKLIDLESFFNNIEAKFLVQLQEFNIKFSVDDKISPYKIKLNIEILRFVVINIIRNAIEVLKDKKDAAINLTASKKNGKFNLIIKDNGHGVDEKDKKNIFEFFYSSGKKYGTGLGLAISKEMLKIIDGEIELLNSDAGAEFSVTLPLEN